MIEEKVFNATEVDDVIFQWGKYRWIKLTYSEDAELDANRFIKQIKNSTTMRFINTSNWNGRVKVIYETFSNL